MANKNTLLAAISPIRSPQLRSVYLHDWWLMKVDGDFNGWKLGVGGFTSTVKLGIRVFCSSAITKRHDHITLETDDGITITLSGFINRSHTLQKGFPQEVCSYFLHGFPYNWKEYADQSSCEESINRDLDGLNISKKTGTRNTLPLSFDDLPVTRVRDLLLTTTGPDYSAITKNIFKDLLPKCGDDSSSSSPCEPSVNLDEENAFQKTPRRSERNNREQKRKEDGFVSVTTQKKRKVAPETPTLTSSTRVVTRSMTQARNLKNKEFENPRITFMKCSLFRELPDSKGSTDNSGTCLKSTYSLRSGKNIPI